MNSTKIKFFKILNYFLILVYLIILDFGLTNLYSVSKNYLIGNLKTNHPIFHHTLKKNSEGGGIISEKYFTNSLGFRDFSIKNVNKENKKKRILLMGDSATMGLFNEYENSYAGKITMYFEKKNIEVLNGAVTSYSPIIYFTKIKHLIDNGYKFDELFLFIDISDPYDDSFRYEVDKKGNVVDKKLTFKKDFITKTKKFISNNFYFFFNILDFINDFFFPDADNSMFAINHQNGLWNIEEVAFNSYGKDGLNSNIYYLDKIKNLLDINNIDMKIIIYPWPGTIYYFNKRTIYEKTWENWAKENNIDIYNSVKIFNFVKNLDKKERLEIINKYYFELDMHFNEEGSEFFFNEFKKFLEG